MKHFEINCDTGELIGNDAEIMPHIDSCSIACGGHIGDANSIEKTIRLAAENGVKVGAHPSFPDKAGFGRRPIDISPKELFDSVGGQIALFQKCCEETAMKMDHIKLHGALYNQAAENPTVAKTVMEALKKFRTITLIAPFDSAISKIASSHGMLTRFEAFADRKYTSDGHLVARSNNKAIITEPLAAIDQVRMVVSESRLVSIDGQSVKIHADTFCVHGDNPRVLDIVRALKKLRDEK